jgi:RNA polymerase sigma-70 factor (ECF subfamily)
MPAESVRREAFEAMFAEHYWAVRGYVLRRSRPASVEDVLADTFLVVWRRLDSVPEDALPWLLGTARRVMANQRRAERRRDALTSRLQAITGTASAWEPSARLSGELADALAVLSEREREALLLIAWEGLSPARAARAAGCSPAAFRVRLYRARRRVAAQLLADARNQTRPSTTEEVP